MMRTCLPSHISYKKEKKTMMTSVDTPLSSLMDSTASPKLKTTEGEGVGARSLACSTLRVEGRTGALGWD
jgi:hypothetical protein